MSRQEEEVPSALLQKGNPGEGPVPVSQAALNPPGLSASDARAPGKAEEPLEFSFTGQLQFPHAWLPSCEPAVWPGSWLHNKEMPQEGRGHCWVSGRPCGSLARRFQWAGQLGAPQGLWPDQEGPDHELQTQLQVQSLASRQKGPCRETRGRHTTGSQHLAPTRCHISCPCPSTHLDLIFVGGA